MKYYIDYNTGVEMEEINGTMEEAMEAAEKGIAYTQQPVTIRDEDGEPVAVLQWWGSAPEEDYTEDVVERFGDFGYYGPWVMI